MEPVTNHVSASLSLLDIEKRGLRTFSGVRRNVVANDVAAFMGGYNLLVMTPATNARHTVRTEILNTGPGL